MEKELLDMIVQIEELTTEEVLKRYGDFLTEDQRKIIMDMIEKEKYKQYTSEELEGFEDFREIIKPKQKTLEEAAYNACNKEGLSWENDYAKEKFIEGAEWQAERMYSKKEVMDMFDTFSMYLPLHYKFLLEEELKKE
jgi:hypothetical protein